MVLVKYICTDCAVPCRLEFELEEGQDCIPLYCVLCSDEAKWREE